MTEAEIADRRIGEHIANEALNLGQLLGRVHACKSTGASKWAVDAAHLHVARVMRSRGIRAIVAPGYCIAIEVAGSLVMFPYNAAGLVMNEVADPVNLTGEQVADLLASFPDAEIAVLS